MINWLECSCKHMTIKKLNKTTSIAVYAASASKSATSAFYSSLLPRNISRFPSGPGSRSTLKPAVCIVRRTSPFAQ